MATQKQIEANRRNAQRSTGPVTDLGKAVAKFNALKHGMTASTAVLPHEDPSSYAELRDSFVATYQPANAVEASLVEVSRQQLLATAPGTPRRNRHHDVRHPEPEIAQRCQHRSARRRRYGASVFLSTTKTLSVRWSAITPRSSAPTLQPLKPCAKCKRTASAKNASPPRLPEKIGFVSRPRVEKPNQHTKARAATAQFPAMEAPGVETQQRLLRTNAVQVTYL